MPSFRAGGCSLLQHSEIRIPHSAFPLPSSPHPRPCFSPPSHLRIFPTSLIPTLTLSLSPGLAVSLYPSLPIPQSSFFPTFSPSHLLNFFLYPLSSAPPALLFPTFASSHLLSSRLSPSTFHTSISLSLAFSPPSHFPIFPTSFFPASPHLNQIWFENHIWCFHAPFFNLQSAHQSQFSLHFQIVKTIISQLH
jgi:hypothetical protein